MKKAQLQMGLLNPDFPLGAPAVLRERQRRISGQNCLRTTLAAISRPNGNSGLKRFVNMPLRGAGL